jgi:membrane protein required for colicin V production
MTPDISWIDACLLAILVVSVLVGLLRGFVFEVLSLAGWVVAWLVAQALTPAAAPQLPVGAPGSLLNHVVAFALVFLVVLVVWGLLARLVRGLVRATPLRAVDRLLGATFGLLRGGFVLLLVAAIVGLTGAAQSPAWRASTLAGGLDALLREIKPLVMPNAPDAPPVRQTESNRGSNPCAASSA